MYRADGDQDDVAYPAPPTLRAVEATALQIGELVGRGEQGVRVLGTPELESEEGHAAHRALLDHPRDLAVQPFLEQHAPGNEHVPAVDGTAGDRTLEGNDVELRLSTLPTAFGEKLVMQIGRAHV